jgi:methylglutaconyl-CoA hydratase
MAFATVKLTYDERIATLTLDRPEKRNAISAEMIAEIEAALEAIEASEARVAILTGAGKAFSAGMDLEALEQMARQSAEENEKDSRRMAKLFRQIYAFPKPLIAAVNGAAIAGGCGLATLADFTLAVPQAKFGYTEARIGFIPALVSVFLIRQIGEKRARELLLTARLFDAEEALRLGLVTEIVPGERLDERARELAGTLLENSPTSLARAKRLLFALAEPELDREIELAIRENTAIRATSDFREGLAAFLEKRNPDWKWR